jgi:uncharacterized phage-associated protein
MRFTPIRETFNQEKATEAAIHLVNLRGGKMHHLKLVKLMYLADRKALLEIGKSISSDRHVSMAHGPVGSSFLRIISATPIGLTAERSSAFEQSFFRPSKIEIQLQPTIKSKQQKLSDRERKILDEVFEEFGHMNRWKIVEITHGYPEWADPEKEELNAIPIPPRDILKAGNKSEEEISDFEKRQAEKSYLESIC